MSSQNSYMDSKTILLKTIGYCKDHLNIQELELSDIGKVPEQPMTQAEILSQNKLPEVMTYEVIRQFAPQACELDGVNYFAHYGIYMHLGDLIETGLPEYALEWIVSCTDYIEQRNKTILTPAAEELLQNSLEALANKYSPKQVEMLKTRLKIS